MNTVNNLTFSQLVPGTRVHILEVTGVFKKNTDYNLGTLVGISKPYDEPLPTNQPFPNPTVIRKKIVDLTLICDGEQRVISVDSDKSITTDHAKGLTIAVNKNDIVGIIRESYEAAKLKKEAASRYDEEIQRCEKILGLLNANPIQHEPKDNTELELLRDEVRELKELLRNTVQAKEINNPVMDEELNQG